MDYASRQVTLAFHTKSQKPVLKVNYQWTLDYNKIMYQPPSIHFKHHLLLS